MSAVVSVSCPVAGTAARHEFSGEGVPGLLVRRVVVEFEQISGLAVDTFMMVGFENDPFLAGRGMTATVRRVDRPLLAVVDHHPYERLIETLTDRVVGDRCAVVEGGAITTNMDDDFGDHIDVATQEQQAERVGPLLSQGGNEEPVVIHGLPLLFQLPQLFSHRDVAGSARGRILTTRCGRFGH